MTTKQRSLFLALAVLAPLAAAQNAGDGYTRNFPIGVCDFQPHGGNACAHHST